MNSVYDSTREYLQLSDSSSRIDIFFKDSVVNKKFVEKLPFMSVNGKVRDRFWDSQVLPSNWIAA